MLNYSEEEQVLRPMEFDEVDGNDAYEIQCAKLPLALVATQLIRVPTGNGDYTLIPAGQATREQFLAAIRDAISIKYQTHYNVTDFINSLFTGEEAVSKSLDDEYDRWYVMDLVLAKGTKVERRLFGQLLTRPKTTQKPRRKRLKGYDIIPTIHKTKKKKSRQNRG